MSIQRLAFRLVMLLLITTLGCGKKLKFPCGFPTTGDCTFTIPGLQNFNCFAFHELSPPRPYQRKVHLRLNVVTYYQDGCSGKTKIDDQVVHVNPNVTSFPYSVVAKIATDKAFTYEFNIQSEDCTECALGYGGGSNQNPTACVASILQILPGPVVVYNGAIPRWQRAGGQNHFSATIAVNTPGQIDNVPRSCGCGVSE
jgi:hypothetical protein